MAWDKDCRKRSQRRNAGCITSIEALERRTLLSLQGNMLFPADNPWNQKITDAPVAANSDTLVNSIGSGSPLHPDFGAGLYAGAEIGIPYNVVSGDQAKVHVVIDAYPDESDLVDVPIPDGAVIDGDPLPAAENTSDRHLIVYDKDNNIDYELFDAHRPSEEEDGQWHAASEAVWDMSKDSFRTPGDTSADAAGLPILPGLVRPDEVLDQGVIDHAIRFTVPRSRDQYVYPASHEAGRNDASLPRMGERFRLKQSFDISGYSAADQVILQALKDYGMIVADNGSSWFMSGVPSDRWDNDDLHALTRIVGSNFEAVDLTPVVSGLDQTTGSAGTRVTVTGLNFSGAAGQLQVLFGGTPASDVVIASDGSVSATAPAHEVGAVDVQVQTPYGISTLVPADQFTYADAPMPPASPNSPLPDSGSRLQVLPLKLDWADSTGATSYDVYLDNVFQANVTASEWSFLNSPSVNVTHAWRIIARGAGGTTTGPDWTFEVDPIAADANADGVVDRADFKVLNDHYGQAGDWSTGDFNGDGMVSFVDFQILELAFGNRTASRAVPVWDSAPLSMKVSKPQATFGAKPIVKPALKPTRLA